MKRFNHFTLVAGLLAQSIVDEGIKGPFEAARVVGLGAASLENYSLIPQCGTG